MTLVQTFLCNGGSLEALQEKWSIKARRHEEWPQGQAPVIRWALLEKFAPLHALRKKSTQTAAVFAARVICSDFGTPRWTRA